MANQARTIVNIHETAFGPYDMEGPVQEDMHLLRGSYDDGTKRGVYVIRMEAGAETIPHTHACTEEYLILEGEVIESDGRVLKAGDLVTYQPGSHHNSRTETGCLMIAFDWDRPGS
jgi:anti-sigma factor ChrR (cupin superfamily)